MNVIAGKPGASCRAGVAQPPQTLRDVGGEGRLNLFQRMMLRWRGLHPYNPVHVVHVPAALDAQRLRAVLAARLEALGLTGFELDAARGRFRFAGGNQTLGFRLVFQYIKYRRIRQRRRQCFGCFYRIHMRAYRYD